MPLKNKNLNKAKAIKDNEFFTLAINIQKELQHYWKHFKNKIILLNCNDGLKSEFWKYFKALFNVIGLKKLIAISYGDNAVVLQYNGKDIIEVKLNPFFDKAAGDFRNPECIDYLQQADIVVTNPPFSLFREYVDMLIHFNKKFLIIGPLHAITYRNIFNQIKNNKIWTGFSNLGMKFNTNERNIKKKFCFMIY